MYHSFLAVAMEEAVAGLSEGGIPIGAAFFDETGFCLGRGRNRRVQMADPSAHGETEAFRSVGRRASYDDAILATTLAPCWFCSGLVVQFRIHTVVIGDMQNTENTEATDWLRSRGVLTIDMQSEDCISMLSKWIESYPDIWAEDNGRLASNQDI
jgi:cytosine/creatinine deaminase